MDVPVLDVRLDAKAEDTGPVVDVLMRVRPTWRREAIVIERLRSGFVNTIWHCRQVQAHDDTEDAKDAGASKDAKNQNHEELKDSDSVTPKQPEDCSDDRAQDDVKDPVDTKESLIVRINPDFDILPLVDRQLEFTVMKTLAARGVIPPLHARFENGLVYQYAEGETSLTFETVNSPHIREMILEKMHVIHALPLSEVHAEHKTIHDNTWYHYLEATSHKTNANFPDKHMQERYEETFKDEASILEEAAFGRQLLQDLFKSYPQIFCHNDIWYTNLVYDKKKDEVHLIDWEMSGVGVVPLELAIITEDFTDSACVSSEAEDAFKRAWVKSYLTKDRQEPADDLIEDLYTDLIKATAAARLGEAVDALWMSGTDEGPKNTAYMLERAIICYKKYKFYKEKILAMA